MKGMENILRILIETKKSILELDIHKIKHLSNQTMHSATISQDQDNIVIAVLIYALGKIFERDYYKNLPGWKEFYDKLIKNLDLSIIALKKQDITSFRNSIGEIRYSLDEIDENLSEYIEDVFRKAQINKAFKIYEHGLSAEKTAELLGISLWDLSIYIGQSTISEAHVSETMPIKERIKNTEEFFE